MLVIVFYFQESFEIVAQIPLNYPHEYPDILVRSPVLDKSGYVKMMSELKSFMVELSDEICMPAIITWLQENINKYIDQFSLAEKSDCNGRYCTNKPTTFSRIWIYSHHIYSSNKRKLILHHAVNLNLTGFCMPGKPGLIVVEGIKYNVDKFWSVIHSLQWQKLTVKEREDFELAESGDKSFAKFENFQERHFNTRQSRGGAHADCGELYKFLEDIECSHVFQSIFGVEGKVPDSNKRK